ncbi:MAG: 16S rRNA (uracil(1498)-N(3))-methyltransferase [Gammaproteobacteria bacterium]|nr:16S rRNA (uracil(1498)-N(3))-methyltransferase [Gammaproteobacteria bacterium]
MRIPRLYHPEKLSGNTVTLTADASQHVSKVLRLREGAAVVIFDNHGSVYNAHVQSAGKPTVLRLDTLLTENNESPLRLHAGIAMIKGDRMSYALQKAVELGIQDITPLVTEHTVVQLNTERRDHKHDHWTGIIQNAAEQAQRSRMPTLHPAIPLQTWVHAVQASLRVYFDTEARHGLATLDTQPTSIAFLIGPEGGLSPAECRLAEQYGFIAVRLGQRVLRAETAVVAVASALQTRWGDF